MLYCFLNILCCTGGEYSIEYSSTFRCSRLNSCRRENKRTVTVRYSVRVAFGVSVEHQCSLGAIGAHCLTHIISVSIVYAAVNRDEKPITLFVSVNIHFTVPIRIDYFNT